MCLAWVAPGSGLEFCKPEAMAQAMAWVAVHSHHHFSDMSPITVIWGAFLPFIYIYFYYVFNIIN